MLRKSTYLYGIILFIFGLLYCIILSYPTKKDIKQYQINYNLTENLPLHINKTTYAKTGVVKHVFSHNDLYNRIYRISCPNSSLYIEQKKNTLRISEVLENAQILLQEREGIKNSCRLFEAEKAFCNYHAKTLSSSELYFSIFDSFFPIATETYWQGVAKEATLLMKKKSSPVLQTDFITFFTPENI